MSDFNSKEFGNKLRELRKSKGLSQDNLANKLNISRTTIGRFESGEMIPNAQIIKELCEILGIYSTELFEMDYKIKNKDDIEMLKMLNYQNFYFVKILLFCCLKYFTNDKKHYIEENNFGFCIMFNYLYIGERLKNKEMTFKKYDEFLYKDKNKKYFEKNKKYVEKIQKETLYLNDEKIDDKKFMEALKKFLK